jgi:hypothetical protein
MRSPTRHRHPLTVGPRNLTSSSPFASLDDPFSDLFATFLFFSTAILAAMLVFKLVRLHYVRFRHYYRNCPLCTQIRHQLNTARTLHIRVDGNCEVLESGNGQRAWNDTAIPDSELIEMDTVGLREDSDHSGESTVSASSNFYTPLPRNAAATASRGYQERDCNTNSQTTRDRRLDDVNLARARRKQIDRNRLPEWPANLQKVVVVGDVKESLIAKRRRSTLGRGDRAE